MRQCCRYTDVSGNFKKMKKTISILTILFILLCSMTRSKTNVHSDLCENIRTSRLLEKHNYSPNDHKKIDLRTLKQLDKATYYKLNGYEKSSGEQNYIYGHFEISKNRVGLICYNKTRECDDNVYFFLLQIIDNCSKAKKYKVLTIDDHDNDILYQWTSSFSQHFDTLTMTLKQTSEWVVGTSLKTDTLFTEIYKINLRSVNLDTISVTKKFKKIKQLN